MEKEKKKEGRGSSQLLRPKHDKLSDPGSIGFKWAAEEHNWVPLFNTIPEVPTLNLSRSHHISCARLRQRLCHQHLSRARRGALLRNSLLVAGSL